MLAIACWSLTHTHTHTYIPMYVCMYGLSPPARAGWLKASPRYPRSYTVCGAQGGPRGPASPASGRGSQRCLLFFQVCAKRAPSGLKHVVLSGGTADAAQPLPSRHHPHPPATTMPTSTVCDDAAHDSLNSHSWLSSGVERRCTNSRRTLVYLPRRLATLCPTPHGAHPPSILRSSHLAYPCSTVNGSAQPQPPRLRSCQSPSAL